MKLYKTFICSPTKRPTSELLAQIDEKIKEAVEAIKEGSKC